MIQLTHMASIWIILYITPTTRNAHLSRDPRREFPKVKITIFAMIKFLPDCEAPPFQCLSVTLNRCGIQSYICCGRE